MRRSVLTLFNDRAPEVGVPGENPNAQPARPGAERFRRAGRRSGSAGRRGRLPAPRRARARRGPRRDGPHGRRRRARRHRGARALGARDRRCAAGRAARDKPSLAPDGVPAALIPDSVAALAALQTAPGLPRPASSRLSTWAAAEPASRWPTQAANLDQIGETVRYPEFSGDQIDQALLNHVSPESPKPTTPTPPARWGSDRWPGCATRRGRPRSGCPPRPRRWCPPSCPASTPTSG